MAQQDLTFITENIPPTISFIQSGISLRLSYVIKKEAKYINDILINNIANPSEAKDPNTIDSKTWDSLKKTWREEARIKYPDEGDYEVWLIDPETQDPVVIGEVVKFLGAEDKIMNPCTEYILNLDGTPLDNSFEIIVNFRDCFYKLQEIKGNVTELGNLTICASETPITNAGIFIKGSICDLNFEETECSEYSWDLTGLPEEIVTLTFINCNRVPEIIQDFPKNIGPVLTFCAQKESPVSSVGILQYKRSC
jgi:hypothetical protein